MTDCPGPAPTPENSTALAVGAVMTIVLVAVETLGIIAAMPVIADELDGDSLYGAVFSAFALAQIVAIAAAGHLTGRRPLHRTFTAGLVLFAVGLILASQAPTMEILVATRLIQGVGGGLLTTSVFAAVTLGFSSDRRPLVLAWVSSAWVAPAFVAPPVAGYLAEEVSWRWVFAGVVPFVPVAGALALGPLRRLGEGDGRPLALRRPLTGGLLIAGGAGLAQVALGDGRIGLMLVGGVVGVGLAVDGARRLLPPAVRTLRTAVGASAALKLTAGAGFFGIDFFIPEALTEVQGLSATVAGLTLTTGSATWTIGSFLAARLAPRVGPRRIAMVGTGFLIAGAATMFVILDPATPAWVAFVVWAIAPIGMGLTFNPANATAMEAATDETEDGEVGDTATALSMSDVMGAAIASGLGGAVLATGEREGWETADSLAGVFGVMLVILIGAAYVASRLPAHPPSSVPTSMPPPEDGSPAEPARPL